MLVKPQLSDESIIDALRANFDILVNDIEFLPIGNDANAWAFRVCCSLPIISSSCAGDRRIWLGCCRRRICISPALSRLSRL